MTNETRLYRLWVDHTAHDPRYKAELAAIADNDGEILDRFYRDLEFGTAGLRGVLGLGTNRMNVFTVARAAQGLALYVRKARPSPGVAVAYDSRNFSAEFAREAACVLAANGVTVHLYAELMPTPALSYAVRELGCDAGINITASHNPAKYNGFKAYGSDGCQIGLEAAAAITGFISATDIFAGVKRMDYDRAMEQGLIRIIPDSFTNRFVSRVFEEALQPEVCAKAGLKLVYTPLNGAGNRCVRQVLEMAGVRDIAVVPEQEHPDGNFPTCPYPNPEIREALDLGIDLCEKTGADLLLATDPDCDRVAVAVRDAGEYRILTGNEAGVLLLDYICKTRQKLGNMPQNPVAVKSVVSSKLADAVAARYGVEMRSVLTGFKFIGETILELERKGEQGRYIFGFEESCGYLSGPYVRDKDAVNASLLLVEMASACKMEGKSLADALEELYARHGIYQNAVENYEFEGVGGLRKMADIMNRLREQPPAEIAGVAVLEQVDYQSCVRVGTGKREPTGLPPANMLEYGLENGSAVIIRPSGTEPKIKVYYSMTGKSRAETDFLYKRYGEAIRQLIGV